MIIPRPSELTPHPGRFVIGSALRLEPGPGAEPAADLLAGYLGPGRARTHAGPVIRLGLDPSHQLELGAEGYRLDIRPRRVELTAPAEAGLLNGVQTLRQLLPPAALAADTAPADAWWWPCISIRDRPRLAWRGLLLDVARHFMPLDYLFETVDRLALHKLNVLHLHLTDDQGWRIEVDGLPRLTDIGAWRTESQIGPPGDFHLDGTAHGGYYSQRELRALVAHAAARGVTIVPEIEMPGHTRAALAAYPNLGNHPDRTLPVWTRWGISEDILSVDDHTLDFCRQVLAQTMSVFPARYVHIGGDECPTTAWHTSPEARRRAARLGFRGVDELHGWFLRQMHDFLAAHDRRAACWDETGHSAGRLPEAMALTAWRDPDHGARAVAHGHQVIMAPHTSTYLDYPQSTQPEEPQGQPGEIVTLEDVHAFDPLGGGALPVGDPAGMAPGVLGVQAQLWTEYAPTPAHTDYLAYPRLCALAETAWSTGPRELEEFLGRLDHHRHRLRALGVPVGRLPAAAR
ncbi:hexosaminidase [Streptacidiphilus sp. MAP12-20]|uniref:beta-N-acetylhexosaminidase n=1 Tax=Streptacidiphilus sp. MAP12-20 TaxID=3156299 RepID=UPI003512DB40